MADPLSIAGSVVGITAAGVQASVKLYALAEKVATANQRVTGIADDVSSTCAVLNQVRELVIPQPDAQGTLRSVFTSIALNDIARALQRCRTVFTEIELLLHRAFDQVGKRHTSHSGIELSRLEKAKWPFLQPQFDDLRTDLRDSKGNLIPMIAVVSLALAQRNGHQRPVHAGEGLELRSSIVQLQRARAMTVHNGNTFADAPRQKMGLLKLFGNRKDVKTNGHTIAERSRGTSSEHTSGTRGAMITQASSPKVQQDVATSSAVGESARGSPPTSPSISPLNAFPAPDRDTQTQEQGSLKDVDPVAGTTENNWAKSRSIPGSKEPVRIQATDPSGERQEQSSPGQKPRDTHQAPIDSSPSSGSTPHPISVNVLTAIPSASVSNNRFHCEGWTTSCLEGLKTGYGNSLSVCPMNLPYRSLERLVREYEDQDLDAYVTMLELTPEQRKLITETCMPESGAEVAYISLHTNTTVSSVFGVLKIMTLKWIVAWRTLSSPELFMPERGTAEVPVSLGAAKSGPYDAIMQRDHFRGGPYFAKGQAPEPLATLTDEEDEYVWQEHEHGQEEMDSEAPTAGMGLHSMAPMTGHHCGGGAYDPTIHVSGIFANEEISDPTTPPEHVPVDGQEQPTPASDYHAHRSRTGLLFPFWRQKNMAKRRYDLPERNEDDIVNNLLARWTNA